MPMTQVGTDQDDMRQDRATLGYEARLECTGEGEPNSQEARLISMLTYG